ncbi:MAG: glucokinase [Phyllobacteriaceae bacterium]|nr:glucokinase [Phyllobacteriaceae bacterium]
MTASDAPLPFPVLLGDIGGTNARFSVLEDPDSAAQAFPNARTADFATIDDAIGATLRTSPKARPRSAVLAVAGPVNGDAIPLTNCPWVVRPRQMLDVLGLDDIVIVNDFEAQALAVSALGPEHLVAIGGGRPEAESSRVVLGPGTGLGVAGLVRARGIWVPVPGEGGHVDLGPRSTREAEIFAHVETIEGRISAEQILCGSGLVNLYRATAAASGLASRFNDPAEVSAAGLTGEDAIAAETLALFAVLLGRLAGDMALVFMGRGGVFLTGGIPQKILPALQTGAFRAAFDDKAPHGALMRTMPVYAVTHPLAALVGLAAFARQPSGYAVRMQGRRWRK